MTRDVRDYIDDIISAMKNAMIFVENISYNEFIKDTKTVYAVLRALEIIGEAVKKIPKNIRNNYLEIPWRRMAGMKDKLIHEYFGISYEMVWKTIKKRYSKSYYFV